MEYEEFKHREMEASQGGDWSLQFSGIFDYVKDQVSYSEESFRIYQQSRDLAIVYYSEQLTPLASGEYLRSYTIFNVTKDWFPTEIRSTRYMGKKHVDEVYIAKPMDNEMSYTFNNGVEFIDEKINLPPKFHVITGHMCTSAIFCEGRKFDSGGGKNYQNILVSQNTWEYKSLPVMRSLIIRRPMNKKVDIRMKDRMVKGNYFELYADDNYERTGEVPLKMYISPHFAVPYQILTPDRIKISIRYLKKADSLAF